MKKLLAYILIAFVCFSVKAQSEIFAKANNLYNEGNYQEAIATYHSILDTKVHSAELYFNLANAYYKTNQVAPSIFYFEKALQLEPNDPEIKNNLVFAQNMTIDAIDEVPKLGLSQYANNVVGLLNYDGWAYLTVALMITFVLLFLLYYFAYQSGRKRAYFLSSLVTVVGVIFALVMAYQSYNSRANDNPAIVFDTEVEVKTDPNLRSDTVFSLHEGTKVQIEETYDNSWVRVKISDGRSGWMPSESMKPLSKY
ncbi:MAG: tetratricopeptide repeat protein [bacterium]